MDTQTAARLDANDAATVARCRANLAAFHAMPPGRERLIAAGPLTVNVEELLEVIERLARELDIARGEADAEDCDVCQTTAGCRCNQDNR
jgi:hypothetical protein